LREIFKCVRATANDIFTCFFFHIHTQISIHTKQIFTGIVCQV
jgi:hypothetical protein